MLSDKIKMLRKERNLTQEELAKLLGISRSYLGGLERGDNKGVNVKLLDKLSDVFDKPIEYFMGKEISLNIYDTLDNAIEMMLKSGFIDSEGNFLNDTAKDMVLEILKKEIQLKIKKNEG